MWEGVLFHLALLLCARQVVKGKRGVSGQEQRREGEGEGRRRKREKNVGGWGGVESPPGCSSAVSQ